MRIFLNCKDRFKRRFGNLNVTAGSVVGFGREVGKYGKIVGHDFLFNESVKGEGKIMY